MRFSLVLGALLIGFNAQAQTPAARLVADLKAKREALPGAHQEFQASQEIKTAQHTQASSRVIVLDMMRDKWREQSVSGAGDRTRIFDGDVTLITEPDSDEYIRVQRKAKDLDPVPGPYAFGDVDWSKAKEIERKPCGFAQSDHTCVVMDLPLKNWARASSGSNIIRMVGGVSRVALDTETGLLIQLVTQESIENGNSSNVRTSVFAVKKVSTGAVPDAALFSLPVGDAKLHDVKSFTPWDAPRIKKQLAGKPAPDLQVMDLQGNLLSLADLKGKTVLLDFWTTWCPPCLADAPALDKLYTKFGGKDLAIVGVSVNEDRGTVETFLKKHPHAYPIVLTTENDMPRSYEIGVFPTYVVISPEGSVATAAQGDQGFGELRDVLKKAGLDTQ
jgi:thiol-disulfide isomerase/thioredoxin